LRIEREEREEGGGREEWRVRCEGWRVSMESEGWRVMSSEG
jgi:hypothetical protein